MANFSGSSDNTKIYVYVMVAKLQMSERIASNIKITKKQSERKVAVLIYKSAFYKPASQFEIYLYSAIIEEAIKTPDKFFKSYVNICLIS